MKVLNGPYAVWTRPDAYYRWCRVARRPVVAHRVAQLQGLYLRQFCSFRPETIRIVIGALESYSPRHAQGSSYTYRWRHRRARRSG